MLRNRAQLYRLFSAICASSAFQIIETQRTHGSRRKTQRIRFFPSNRLSASISLPVMLLSSLLFLPLLLLRHNPQQVPSQRMSGPAAPGGRQAGTEILEICLRRPAEWQTQSASRLPAVSRREPLGRLGWPGFLSPGAGESSPWCADSGDSSRLAFHPKAEGLFPDRVPVWHARRVKNKGTRRSGTTDRACAAQSPRGSRQGFS